MGARSTIVEWSQAFSRPAGRPAAISKITAKMLQTHLAVHFRSLAARLSFGCEVSFTSSELLEVCCLWGASSVCESGVRQWVGCCSTHTNSCRNSTSRGNLVAPCWHCRVDILWCGTLLALSRGNLVTPCCWYRSGLTALLLHAVV